MPPPQKPNPTSAESLSLDASGHLSADAIGDLVDRPSLLQESTEIWNHLQSCSVCSVQLDELNATVKVLGDVPLLDPPRSFAIHQKPVAPRETRARSWFETLKNPAFPAFRIATAGVLALFIVATTGAFIANDRDPADQPALVQEADSPALFRETTSEGDTGPALHTGPADEPESADAEMAAPADEAVIDDAPVSESTGVGSDVADEEAFVDGDQLAEPSEPVAESEGISNWRLAQITSVLLLGWLTVTWIGLERLRRRYPDSSNS